MKRFLTNRAKELRRNQTDHEAELWYYLRAKRFKNLKFYRQYAVEPYIVDFYCPENHVIIELDGSWHLEDVRREKDSIRDKFLSDKGYKIFRIWNHDWREHRDEVLESLANFVNNVSPPTSGGRARERGKTTSNPSL